MSIKGMLVYAEGYSSGSEFRTTGEVGLRMWKELKVFRIVSDSKAFVRN
jgi:hypothetical protein